MTDVSLIFSGVASLSSGVAMLFAYVSLLRSRRHDSRADGEHAGAVMTELGYIKSGIDDIKHRQDKQEARHTALVERLAAVETALKLK